jgi:hypothetical protein
MPVSYEIGVAVPLKYSIDGRQVSEAEWNRHVFHDAPRRIALDALQKRVSHLRCAVHGRPPKLAAGRDTVAGFEIKVEACCDDLLRRAQGELKLS